MTVKNLSIKTRVSFWYTFTMVIMIALVFSILILAGKRAALDDAKESLIISTDMAVNNVTVTDGHLIIDDDFIYYMDHTWIVLVKEDGSLISGLTPKGFPENIPYQADKILKAGSRKNAFYVYDRLIENQKTGKIWIRGMTPASLSVRDPAISQMIRLFMIVLPILIGLSLAGGWLITRRAFLPLKQINDTVALIQEGSDLSKRIGTDQESPQDEIQITAAAFDRMLDRIGSSFEREKQFTNDASHELRTPAAVIQAQCEYALENIDNPQETAESIRIIHNQSKKMSSLIEQLLMLARADRSAIIIDRTNTDISLLAEEAASVFFREASEKNISVKVNAPEGIYGNIDAALISRAIENLLSNAIKYGKTGGHIIISIHRLDNGIVLTVSDDGIGIEEKDIKKIWDRFYRVDPTCQVEGLGLGLPLVKWIIKAHGGSISVTSQPMKHTEFKIFLPA